MTSRSASTIMRTADPAADAAVDDAWSDAEGRATYERIITDDQPAAAIRPPRRRRRVLIGVGLAAAAGAAVAVVGIPGASHNGTPAAWSVTRNPDGTVTVKIADYRDPAGLQARLRAVGLRADVGTSDPSCGPQYIPGTPSQPAPGTYTSVIVNADLSTFTPPYDYTKALVYMGGWPMIRRDPRSGSLVSAAVELMRADDTMRSRVSLTIDPRQIPRQDHVFVGFPADQAGNSMTVQIDRSGKPWSCG